MGRAAFPGWSPHPDVWLLVGLLGAAYATALARLGPKRVLPGAPTATGLEVACFSAGLLALLVASDWPVHDVGEGYLYTAHMVQHLTYTLVAAPLLLMGTPAWLAREVLSPPGALALVRRLARFLPATIVFNAVIVFIHIPSVVDRSLHSGLFHFGIHTLVVVSALVVWLPVLSPLPEVPRFAPPLAMLFLFMQSMLPTVPASFLTFGDHPLYRFYEQVPRLWGISALDDMRIAGLIMKIAGGMVLWTVIAIVFFRWYSQEEGAGPRRVAPHADREPIRMGLTEP